MVIRERKGECSGEQFRGGNIQGHRGDSRDTLEDLMASTLRWLRQGHTLPLKVLGDW